MYNCYNKAGLTKMKVFTLVTMFVMVLMFFIAQGTKNALHAVDCDGMMKRIKAFWVLYFCFLLFFKFYMLSGPPSGFPVPKMFYAKMAGDFLFQVIVWGYLLKMGCVNKA